MSIVFRIHPEHQLVETTVSGEISLAEFEAYWETLRADPTYRPEYDALIDLRATRRIGPLEELLQIAARQKSRLDRLRPTRRAVVIKEEMTFRLMRRFEALTGGDESPYRVFRTMEEAERWLRLPEEWRTPGEQPSAWIVGGDGGLVIRGASRHTAVRTLQ
jgi:hypothetical protein